MARMPPGGNYGGGYIKVQQHLRTAIMSVGFALVTTAPFTADLAVPSITQAQLTGYKYPVKQVRHTQFQDGWLYTGSLPFDSTITGAPIEQSQLEGYRYPRRTVRQTEFQDGWLETAANPPFDPTITGAPIEQSQVEGYRAPRRPVRQTDPQPVYELLGTYSPALTNESSRPSKKPWRGQTEFQDGWLYTAATPTFDETATVAPVVQSRLDGYRYPVRTVRQTEPQEGWVYPNLPEVWDESKFQNNSGERTPAAPATRYRYAEYPNTDWLYPTLWTEDKFQNISGDLTPVRSAVRYRYDGYPATDWIYQNLPVADVWDETKFQNISGDMTPVRPALKFRYPLASAGFSTDGSTPDAWDASKFQNISGDRTATRKALLYRYDGYPATDWIYQNLPIPDVWDESKFQPAQSDRMRGRRKYDSRYEYQKFPFGLLDARVVMPAIDQLANSERAAKRKGVPIVNSDSPAWIYQNLPVADVWNEAKFQNISGDRTPTRKSLGYRYDGYPATDWIYQNLPAAFDPQYLIHSDDSRMRERYKKVPQLDQPASIYRTRSEQAVSDTVSLTETFTKQVGKPVADAISLVDELAKQIGKSVIDTVSLTESFVKQVGKSLSDTVGLSEAFASVRTVLRDIGDTLGFTETVTKSVQKQQSETVVLTEFLAAQSSGAATGSVMQPTLSITIRIGIG